MAITPVATELLQPASVDHHHHSRQCCPFNKLAVKLYMLREREKRYLIAPLLMLKQK